MEFKGTKGKWNIYEPNHIGCTNVKFGEEEWDGFIEVWHHHSNKKEAKANALLISKSPEMLEMLKEFVDNCCGEQECEEELIKGLGNTLYNSVLKAKQLIKKATEL